MREKCFEAGGEKTNFTGVSPHIYTTVGTHYGLTQIYGPTGHAIGGTAQLALRSSSAAAIIAGPRHSQ